MQPKTRKNKKNYLPNGQHTHSTAAARPVRRRYKENQETDAEQEEQPE